MNIVVCLKQVLDPEVPPAAFEVPDGALEPRIVGVPAAQVVDSYAENALEAGLRLRDAVPGSRVTALCVGGPDAADVLRRAFAITADAGVRVWDENWSSLDGLATAHVLACAIRNLGGADLILCGRQAADIEEGVVGPAVAEELGVGCLTLARHLEARGEAVRVERDADGVIDTLDLPLPGVVTIASSEHNVPRMAKIKDKMLAARKRIEVYDGAAVGVEPGRVAPGVRMTRLFVPDTIGECEFLTPEEPQAQAAALMDRLAERNLI